MEKDIEILEELLSNYEKLDYRFGNMLNCKQTNALEHLIQAYKEQQAELEKKDKIIDELEYIFYNYQLCEYEITDCTYRKCEYIADDEKPPCRECIKQYFERIVEDDIK